MSWKTLGAVAPTQLVDARLQLHHAAQVVASAGVTFLAPRPDDSHPNLGWVEPLAALTGHSFPDADAQVGLRVADLSLLLVDKCGDVNDEFALDGKGPEDGYAWLAGATARAGAQLPSAGITRAAYEIPGHPTGSGEAFSCKSHEAFTELARWFANGHRTLPSLPTGGHWHTEGYTSAILTGSDLVGGSPESQRDRLHAFLDASVDVCQRILTD